MEEFILKNEYRCINDGEKTKWKQLTSIGEFIWDGVYAIRLVVDDPSLGLPFKVNGEEVINLLVNDQFRDNHIQNNRIIVQTLTRVDRATGEVLTYTRTRRYNNGEHKWGEWVNNDNGSNSGGVVTGSSIAVDKNINIESTNPVQNKAIAKALEDAVARGRELAKRDLYIAAGALYNDTDEVIKRTAFWGAEVDHLPHHYYLNGLGDITEDEMNAIYKYKDFILLTVTTDKMRRYFTDSEEYIRTFLGVPDSRFLEGKVLDSFSTPVFYIKNIVNVKWINSQKVGAYTNMFTLKGTNIFYRCPNLKVIERCKISTKNVISHCNKLEDIEIYGLNVDFVISESPLISKNSLLYMINNSVSTSAITITLHTDAYTRLIGDAEVIAALEAKSMISLVSA